jgi:hypothetical protein
VPLAILNTGALWPSGSILPESGVIKVAIGEPMAIRSDEPLNQIAQRAFQTLEGLYKGLEGSQEPSKS